MNRDQIENMEAGPEMDRLIVERVMGQTDFSHPGFYWTEGNLENGDGWSGFYCPKCGADEGSNKKCIKHYSTYILDAWEIESLATCFAVENRQIYDRNEWYAEVALGGYTRGASANTAPLAICRAALLATME